MLNLEIGRKVASDLHELVAKRRSGFSLPADFYISREVFDMDIEAIFARVWIFVGPAASVREPGDYQKIDLGRYSIILIRSEDMEVRAFHNVCRHRGSQLLTEISGSVGNIVCPYHQWSYDTSGTLIHAGEGEIDPRCYSLKPIHVKNVEGLIYICLAKEPPADFQDFAAAVSPYLAPHGLKRAKVAHQVDILEKGNWKLTIENNRECYHCDGHPELLASSFGSVGYNAENAVTASKRHALSERERATRELEKTWNEAGAPWAPIEMLDNRLTGFRTERYALAGAGESMTATAEAACKRTLGEISQFRFGNLHLHTQPNGWNHFQADQAITFAVFPVSPGESLLRTTWLVHEDAVEGVDYEIDSLTRVWQITNDQDRRFIELAQRGAESPAYEPGPYVPSEYMVAMFTNWYIDRVNEVLAQRA